MACSQKTKPKLNAKLWETRLQMAKERIDRSETAYIKANARKVQADEKWCTEEKGTMLGYEARDDSPVPDTVKFKEKDAETRTQLCKIMFIFCVTSTNPIGYWELDFKKWNDQNDAKTKGGKKAKGITGQYMAGIIKQIAKKARQVLGPEPITFLHDKAPCYQSVMADIKKGVITDGLGFDGGLEMAAGKAPDMSYLDAGICPFMEREVEEAGAQSADEIRVAVKAAWKKVTPEMCVRIAKRVRRNMKKVIEKKGGNFYAEGSKK